MLALEGRVGIAAVDVGACKVFPANEGSWEQEPGNRSLGKEPACSRAMQRRGEAVHQLLGAD